MTILKKIEDGKYIKLDATQLSEIIYLSKTIENPEQLIPEMGETPVDFLFGAIVAWMKAHGKM